MTLDTVDYIETRRYTSEQENAVAESLLWAYSHDVSYQLGQELRSRHTGWGKSPTLEEITKKMTHRSCVDNSFKALYFLLSRQPELFDAYLLVTGTKNHRKQFTHRPWGNHTYFLVHGTDGYYYAGSPANFVAENSPPIYNTYGEKVGESPTPERYNPLDVLLKSPSLDEIMMQIESFDGGEWPTSTDIATYLETSYKPPEISREIAAYWQPNEFPEGRVQVELTVTRLSTYHPDDPNPYSTIERQQSLSFWDLNAPV